MKSETGYAVVAIVCLSFLVISAVGNQKAGWKGKIEEEDGVKIIKNPVEPMYGEIELELELDLSIGGEEFNENYNFMTISDVEVDEEGNILVLDSRQLQIQKYDKNGKYVRTIGRKGEGPGEFMQAYRIYLDSDGKLYVSNFRKIHIFDENNVYERSVNTESFLSSYGVTKEGNFMGRSSTFAGEDRTMDIILMSSEGKKTETIVNFPDPSVMIKQKGMSIISSPPYSPSLYFYPLNKDSGIYGVSSEYKLFVIKSTGEISYRIDKDEKLQTTSKKEEDEYVKKQLERRRARGGSIQWSEGDLRKLYKFAKYKPFYTNIFMDDEGHLFLPKPKSVLDPEKDTSFDLFNQEGYYLHKIKIHEIRLEVIKKGFIYTYRTDPDSGYYKVERYRIKNWDQVKD